MATSPNPTVEQTRKMLKDEDTWPNWPVLPMKNRRQTGRLMQLGYILASSPMKFELREGNIFRIDPNDKIIATYGTVEELIDAGWVVD
jgi:hypothetical protein